MKRFVIAFIMIGLFSFLSSCSSKGQNNPITMTQLLKDEFPNGERIILAKMSEGEVQTAIKDFIKLCADHGDHIASPVVTKNEDGYVLRLPDSTTYDLFCYWVNYIVYSNKTKRYNDSVVGWYEVPALPLGVWKPFAGQKLMFFIPATDNEFDNVYFTTKDSLCYKQEFAGRCLLKKQKAAIKDYIPRG